MAWDINREIARHICLAQISSDAGKHKYILNMKGDDKAWQFGYSEKDKQIVKAIRLIDSVPISKIDFRYYVVETPDQRGNKSRLVYFYDCRNKLQISFHTFDGRIKKHINKGVYMFWDNGSSRDAAAKLIKIYYL